MMIDSKVLEQELERIKNKLQYPCIAILGKTGTGKSTLIKEIFNIDTNKLETGAGDPITKSYENKYPNPPREDKPIFLYDSPGYEAHQTEEFLEATIQFLKKHSFKENPSNTSDNIHLVWYTVSGKRFEKFDKTVIEKIYELGIPLIIVLTQVDSLKDVEFTQMKYVIEKYVKTLSNTIEILEVAASPKYEQDKKRYKGKLVQLVDKSIELLPVVYKDAFIYAQKINIKSKRKVAWSFIGVAATLVYGTSFLPIPGTTPAASITAQNGLLKQLTNLYNAKEYSEALSRETKSLDETTLILVASFIIDIASTTLAPIFPFAFVPVQSIAGLTAAAYILVLGLTYVSTMEQLGEKYLNSNGTQEEIQEYLKEVFKKNFEKYSLINLDSKEDIDKIGEDFING